ncbi:ProQ/FINO family protein [Aquisalimonas asiatica]|uniref:ProP effector n=1 Tax=Aquisalimonas asiatica TaxID=406100 RepID=A0A1H8V345_9GAMM|nr:ProQ/FINO family protein [Aquisalimonas asiatica]SEP09647.1 ProP effector [Aquisalimonas asiatica]
MATSETQKRQRAERTRAFLDQLMEQFPACFTRDREQIRPLAIGIQKSLRDALARNPETEETPGWLVRQALALYTRSPAYLDATIARRNRIHLDGSDAGEVSDEAVRYAQERRDEQKKRRAAKRKQHAKAAKPRKPSAEERKQQKLEALARKFNA